MRLNPQPNSTTHQPNVKMISTSHCYKEEPLNWSHYQQPRSIFGSNQKNIVLFAYNKQKDQNSPQEIMILEQPKKKYKREFQLQQACYPQQGNSQTQEKLFLQKVDPLQKVQIAEEIKQMLSLSNSLSMQDRLERRKEIFQSSKARKQNQRASEEVLANRIIRVVKMDSLMQGGSIRGVVQLGAKPYQYEMLNLNESQQDYYTLVKKVVRSDQIFPQIEVQDDRYLFEEISYEPDEPIKEYGENDDQYDSNDSDNPRFDYPDEDVSDRSSEDIIPRDFNQQEGEYYDNQENMVEDEEEVYRRYLRREKKRQQQVQYDMDVQEEYEDF